MYGDRGYEVGIKGYSIYVEVGVHSMFRNAERTFTNAECTFPTAEHRMNAYWQQIGIGFVDVSNWAMEVVL